MTSDDAERELQTGKLISFRAPASLARRIEDAASRELISTGAWVRRAALRATEATEARPMRLNQQIDDAASLAPTRSSWPILQG